MKFICIYHAPNHLPNGKLMSVLYQAPVRHDAWRWEEQKDVKLCS